MSYARPNLTEVRKLPALSEIIQISDPNLRLSRFHDFFWCKNFEASIELTKAEKQLNDTFAMISAIPRKGWGSVFEDTLNYSSIIGVIDLLNFCGCTEIASAFAEALPLFHNGRTDLYSNEQRRDAGIRGFRHAAERRRFHALGDILEKLPLSNDHYNLRRWPDAHRAGFEDFPSP